MGSTGSWEPVIFGKRAKQNTKVLKKLSVNFDSFEEMISAGIRQFKFETEPLNYVT